MRLVFGQFCFGESGGSMSWTFHKRGSSPKAVGHDTIWEGDKCQVAAVKDEESGRLMVAAPELFRAVMAGMKYSAALGDEAAKRFAGRPTDEKLLDELFCAWARKADEAIRKVGL